MNHRAQNDVASPLPRQNDSQLLLGLIGSGIQKSLTPAMQEAEAQHHGLRLHYQLIDLEPSSCGVEVLPTLIQSARVMGFAGLNITYPCKQAVIPLLDELTDEARAMGAVNTVVFREGRAIGHNTDGSGWAWGLRRALPQIDMRRVVLLGAGGAGSAIAHAALRMGAQHLVVVDSEFTRAKSLAHALHASYGPGRASACMDIGQALSTASGLIHATPTGMAKLPGMPLPAALLHPNLWVSEIVYFPLETALLRAARSVGCPVADGGNMAVGQAVGAFELFTGCTPDATRMDAFFRQLVSAAPANA